MRERRPKKAESIDWKNYPIPADYKIHKALTFFF